MNAAAAHPAEPEIWVVVCSDDMGQYSSPEKRGVPIVMETNVEGATREEATRRAAQLEKKYGACRIARVRLAGPPSTPSLSFASQRRFVGRPPLHLTA